MHRKYRNFWLAIWISVVLSSAPLTLFGGSASPSPIMSHLDCDARVLLLELNAQEAVTDVVVRLALAQHAPEGSACQMKKPVQTGSLSVGSLVPGTTRILGFSEWGISTQRDCDVYLASARIVSRGAGKPIDLSCASSAAEESLGYLPPEAVERQGVEDDLVLVNDIDLLQIGGGGCLSLEEYAVQVKNISASTSYDVTIDSKYICSTTTTTATECTGGGGNGSNLASEPIADLTAGSCSGIQYERFAGSGAFTPPACCDTVPVAVQCASYTVTAIDGQPVTPIMSPETMSEDGASQSFNCNFTPSQSVTRVTTDCFPDVDNDAVVTSKADDCSTCITCCDNCPEVANPSQTDTNGDGIGDACAGSCDNDGFCDWGEDSTSCSDDCPVTCGDDICEAQAGEDCVSCPADCNGTTMGPPPQRFCCGDPGGEGEGCVDSRCDEGGFTCNAGLPSPICGDLLCEGNEDSCNCEVDCCAPPTGETRNFNCDDSLDNDCDGLTDCDDSDCTTPPPDPACETCVPTHGNEKGPRCSDGIDNDCDGPIDGADPDCQ